MGDQEKDPHMGGAERDPLEANRGTDRWETGPGRAHIVVPPGKGSGRGMEVVCGLETERIDVPRLVGTEADQQTGGAVDPLGWFQTKF